MIICITAKLWYDIHMDTSELETMTLKELINYKVEIAMNIFESMMYGDAVDAEITKRIMGAK